MNSRRSASPVPTYTSCAAHTSRLESSTRSEMTAQPPPSSKKQSNTVDTVSSNACYASSRLWTARTPPGRHGYAEVARKLLQAGAGVNVRGFHGWTPLHLARAFGHVEVASVLCEAGGDWELVDNDGVKAKEARIGHGWFGVVTLKQCKVRYELHSGVDSN